MRHIALFSLSLTKLFGKYPIKNQFLFVLLSVVLLFSQCSIRKKRIPEGKYLLKKNSIAFKAPDSAQKIRTKSLAGIIELKLKDPKVNETILDEQVFLKPNKRVIFGLVPIPLMLNNFFTYWQNVFSKNKGKVSGLGETPIILEESAVAKSAANIQTYLFNKGYFEAVVSYTIRYKKKKAFVTYWIQEKSPYEINSFLDTSYNIDSTKITKIAKKIADSLENNGTLICFRPYRSPVDIIALGESRTAISKELQNQGYFYFSPDRISFRLDSNNTNKTVGITLFINSLLEKKWANLPYHFGKGSIEFNGVNKGYNQKNLDSFETEDFRYNVNHYPIDSVFMESLVTIKKGELYNVRDIEITYAKLNECGLFSNIDIAMETDTLNLLVIPKIALTPRKNIYFSLEPQALFSPQGTANLNGFNNGSNINGQSAIGVAGIATFTLRNANRRGQTLQFSSATSFESVLKRDANQEIGFALQQGFNANYIVPEITRNPLFSNRNRYFNYIRRRSVFSIAYQFENNRNFTRSILPASWSIQLLNLKSGLSLTPIELNFSRNEVDPDFLARLTTIDQEYVKRIFTNNITTPSRIIYFNTINTIKNYQSVFYKINLESSGNLHRVIRRFSEKDFDKNKSYTLLGQKYFQYTKLDVDATFNQKIDNGNSVHFHTRMGIALPYGNSKDIPFDRRYFIGGSNSLRAWRPRKLGPGTQLYTRDVYVDRSGEMLFEANFEYRVVFSPKLLYFALFYDIGNTWNLGPNRQPAGTPVLNSFSQFFDEMAMNTGMGMRLDFTYFILRVDWGLPIFDPGKPITDRWVLNKPQTVSNRNFINNYIFKETALALGIGYPF